MGMGIEMNPREEGACCLACFPSTNLSLHLSLHLSSPEGPKVANARLLKDLITSAD